jgi:hypothetical protein
MNEIFVESVVKHLRGRNFAVVAGTRNDVIELVQELKCDVIGDDFLARQFGVDHDMFTRYQNKVGSRVTGWRGAGGMVVVDGLNRWDEEVAEWAEYAGARILLVV